MFRQQPENFRTLRGGQFSVWLASQQQPINFALTAQVRGPLTLERCRTAIELLRRKYPPLAMRLREDPPRCVTLVPDPALEIPLQVRERHDPDQWINEAALELSRPFDMNREPPLRLVWLRQEDPASDLASDLILVCPHALADGYAAAYLVRDFLTYAANPDATVKSAPSVPGMSDLIPGFPGKSLMAWRYRRKAALMRFFLKHGPGPATDPFKKQVSVEAAYAHLAWALDPGQTARLVARCRAEATTVHAALGTAFLRAFADFRQDGWRRRMQSPVSLRDRLSPPAGEAFGLFVNLVEVSADCSPHRNFWEIARDLKIAFLRRTRDQQLFRSLVEGEVMMDKIGDLVSPEMVSRSFLKVRYDLSISNLGRLDFPVQYGPLQLQALYGPSLGGNPEDIVLGVITIAGKIHFTLTFTKRKLNLTQAAGIKESAMRHLESSLA